MPLNEGQTVQYTVVTTRVADGTVLYWKTTGNTTNSDIVGGNTGSVTITNNQGVFNVTTSADVNTDGVKTLGISLSTGSQSGPTVTTTAAPIIVNDTSLSPAPVTLWITGTDWYNGTSVGVLAGAGPVGGTLSSPTQVGSTTTWSSLHLGAGTTHFAIRQDDTLWGWGSNSNGDLGISGSNRSSPTQIGSDTWRTVTVGAHYPGGAGVNTHTVGIKKDNTLWGWGYPGGVSSYGLGIGTGATVPTSITSGTWSSISLAKNSGAGGLLAVKSDGTLWSCGYNGFGAIGDNTTTNRGSLVQIGNGTTWMSVARSYHCGFAIKSDGTLWAWGTNNNGALGLNRGTSYTSSPIQVGALTNWSSIEANGSLGASVLAIKNDGTLWGWGRNGNGQLGTGNFVGYSSPVQIGTDNTWSKIATGGMKGNGGTDFEGYTLGLKTNGTIWGWGTSFGAALGLPVAYRNSPTQIGSSTDWRDISAGVNTSAFLKY
jgi:alpha-tubulin suppressor-like RCC1 family protein